MFFSRHPKGLYLLFTTEMWERFSFYTMQMLLILYATASVSEGGLGMDQSAAIHLFGLYYAAVYITPLFGGYLADRFLGLQKSVILGGILMSMGHFLMIFNHMTTFCLALVFLSLGNGCFKPCLTSMLGQLYEKEDPRRDSAFNIFYLGINTGAFLAGIIGGVLQLKYGYDIAFGVAGIGMLVGLFIFLWGKQSHIGQVGAYPERRPSNSSSPSLPFTFQEKQRLFVLCVLSLITCGFFFSYSQAGSCVLLFIDHSVHREVAGFTIPTAWYRSLNPFFILFLSPFFAWLWEKLAREGRDLTGVSKINLGMIIASLSFLFLSLAAGKAEKSPGTLISSWWIVGWEGAMVVAELLIITIFYSFVTRMAPKRCISTMMGLLLLSMGIGGYLGGEMGDFFVEKGPQQAFQLTGWILGGLSLFLLLLRPLLNRMCHLEEPSIQNSPEGALEPLPLEGV